jgi:hypothetical protein
MFQTQMTFGLGWFNQREHLQRKKELKNETYS